MSEFSLSAIIRRLVVSSGLAGLLAAVALGTVVMSAATPHAAKAETFTWRFMNSTNRTIQVKIWSKSRNWVWPSRTRVYVIPPTGQVFRVHQTCVYGEKLCYGGWFRSGGGLYWGVGRYGNRGCANCCYRCEGGQSQIRRMHY